jgi:hypothetical protein
MARAAFQLPQTLLGTFAEQFPDLVVSAVGSAVAATQKEMNALITGVRETVDAIAGAVVSGAIDAAEFGRQLAGTLEPAHGEAFSLGRRRGGDLAAFDDVDALRGERIMDDERPFLDRFVKDIQEGRYSGDGGELSAAGILARARLYVRSVESSADDGFVSTGFDDESYNWRLGSGESCSDCVTLSEGGPYTVDELAGRYPGSGSTVCLVNCQCVLERSDGVASFERVTF